MAMTPFRNAEQAWFWFCRMQQERLNGLRPNGNGAGRPCDIDDIALSFRRLCRSEKITHKQETAMVIYGFAQRPPDKRVDPMGLQSWTAGLDRLHTKLAEKGIVETQVDNPARS